jgi:hypothetical protein
MTDQEIETLWRFIRRSVDRILACLNGLNEEELNWYPLPSANSLYVLATHAMANVESNILGVLCGLEILRNRDDEFKAKGTSSETLFNKWHELQKRISTNLSNLPPDALNQEYKHPRLGMITGRYHFIVIARHMAEHVGHSELTRDLLFTRLGRELPVREF